MRCPWRDQKIFRAFRGMRCGEFSYAVPDFADATEELADLVLRRHLGLPWQIGETERLILRELAAEDAEHIPEEEYGAEEKIFRFRELLERYIKNQYGFYEYGIWAVVEKRTGRLAGLAGVSNPNLPPEAEAFLAAAGENGPDACPWLELGYHIFRPFRRMGYGREAVREAADYAQEVLRCRSLRPDPQGQQGLPLSGGRPWDGAYC